MFIFYDTETTGLDKDFSQILQIAMVFTDDDLNILSGKKLECRRSPWVVPSPGAMLTTGFAPDDLKKSKLSHTEMMREVDTWVRSQHWPLTFVGYNSISYDEPILAQNFHQNLLDPGLTQAEASSGVRNGRADVMLMVKTVAAYMPGALKLDIKNNFGKPSMTLINVAQQNGVALSEGDAHDAMNDIRATIGVAKVIQKAAPQIWEQLLSLSTPAGVDAFLQKNDVFTYLNNKAAVLTNVTERVGSTTHVMFDLSMDPAPYLAMSETELMDAFRKRNEKGEVSPFVLVRKNAAPVLMPLDQSDRVLPKGFDESVAVARAAAIKNDPEFQRKLALAAVIVKGEEILMRDDSRLLPEELLDRETPASVRDWMDEFHAAPDWKSKAALVRGFALRFEDELKSDPAVARFEKFVTRIVFEHAPEELPPEKREAMQHHVAVRAVNPDLEVPYMTVAKARQELDKIEKERAAGKKWKSVSDTQIRSLKLYYTAIEKELAPHAPAEAAPEAKKPADNKFQP